MASGLLVPIRKSRLLRQLDPLQAPMSTDGLHGKSNALVINHLFLCKHCVRKTNSCGPLPHALRQRSTAPRALKPLPPTPPGIAFGISAVVWHTRPIGRVIRAAGERHKPFCKGRGFKALNSIKPAGRAGLIPFLEDQNRTTNTVLVINNNLDPIFPKRWPDCKSFLATGLCVL